MKMINIFLGLGLLVLQAGCSKSGGGSGGGATNPPPVADTFIYKGADVSWLTQMESSGVKFYNAAGTSMDCLTLLQGLGINTIRLRAWVNPAGGWNNNADLVAKAKRVKSLGMRLLLDLHYSDTWADPAHQAKPAAWAAEDLAGLTASVYSYTAAVLDTLKLAGVVPSWVQVGNETNDGMLWPEGKASTNMAGFAALVESGYKAVKAANDSIKVIVHISNGYDNALFRWIFDGLRSNGAHWDIIGISLYPTVANWPSNNADCLTNMKDMVSRYGKPVMIVEVGMPADQASVCQSFLADIIEKTKSVPGGNGLGVFYWEPEAYNNWQGYGMGAFDNSGKPSAAMNAFKN